MTTLKAPGTTGTRPVLPVIRHFKYEHFVAGISGGALSSLMLHPLDLVKIRFAVDDGNTKTAPKYSGLKSAVQGIIKTEGFRGLYRGVLPNVIGSGGSWGFYFLFFNSIKTWIQEGESKEPLPLGLQLAAGAEAGILTLLLTNPMWVVKTRLCLQYANDVHMSESKKYVGMFDAFNKIWKTEGIRGLYKGFVPGMFGVSHGAIQFMSYEQLKSRYNIYKNKPVDTKFSTLEYIFLGATSKLIAAVTTYPYQVVRARLQDHHHNYTGSWQCILTTLRGEGWRGFYKGLSVNLTRVIPSTVICFVTYEHISDFLLKKSRTTNQINLYHQPITMTGKHVNND